MNNNVIGVFDSGLGGLTAMKELCRILPNENIVYFGDTARVPYGTRSDETILKYSRQDLNFLSQFNAKAVLVACGTISAVALDKIKNDFSFPLFGVIDSAANAAVAATKNKRIGIIGTSAAIRSGAYERKIHELSPDCRTLSIACPLFVPLIENGHIAENDPLIENAVQLYLENFKEFGADVLILGCTHYPIIAHTIGSFVGDEVVLVNTGREAAKSLKAWIEANDMLSSSTVGTHSYYVSESTENFETIGGIFMCHSINGEVHKIDIGKY